MEGVCFDYYDCTGSYSRKYLDSILDLGSSLQNVLTMMLQLTNNHVTTLYSFMHMSDNMHGYLLYQDFQVATSNWTQVFYYYYTCVLKLFKHCILPLIFDTS